MSDNCTSCGFPSCRPHSTGRSAFELLAPPSGAMVAVKDNTSDLPLIRNGRVYVGFYALSSGTVKLTTWDNLDAFTMTVVAGAYYSLCVRRVLANNTSADILVVWV